MPDGFAGQWIGRSNGDAIARVVIDLDDGEQNVRGSARVFFSDGSPGTICEIELPRVAASFTLSDVPLAWMPAGEARVMSTEQIRAALPNGEFPDRAKIEFRRDGNNLDVSWSTDVGTSGEATLERTLGSSASKLDVRDIDWDGFKRFALTQTPGSFIFRGQPEPVKLRTAFHRTHRKDLIRYVSEDIPLAHQQLTARTRHIFNLHNSQETGAFYNLLQHHGYPTPLLDWSHSPFVAAFFAYRRRKASDSGSDKVRILAFDKVAWKRAFRQLEAINFAEPHFSILEALAIENPRAIPQQAISTLTNVDDIEEYVCSKEKEGETKYLHAIDLPASIRPHVMAELSLMGITAGSLFPGLDGACEELTGRMFHHQVPPILSK